jgi:hypothetical protein
MKVFSIVIPMILFFINKEIAFRLSVKSNMPVPGMQQDSTNWIQDFRKFRDAVYKNDRATVKSFIDFPIMNDNNEIWFLVYGGDKKGTQLMGSDKKKPFTEKDFDLYYEKLFSKRFIKAILKIKTEELVKKAETATAEIGDGKATTYKIYASFDKDEHMLSLNLSSNTQEKDENGAVMDGGEFSILYQFTILKNGHIKFRQVRLAG